MRLPLNHLALILAPLLAAGQEPSAGVVPVVAAEIVSVDVRVTDRKGRPVAGLPCEAFRVFDEGQAAALEVCSGPQLSAASQAAEPGQAAGAGPAALRRETPPVLVVYVDPVLLGAAGRRRALEYARVLSLDHIAGGGRLVLMAGEDSGPRALTALASRADEVGAALDSLARVGRAVPAAIADERVALEQLEGVLEVQGCAVPLLLSVVDAYASRRVGEAQAAAERLRLLVDAMAAIDGRKSLVYLSEGLEQRPGIQLHDQLTDICPDLSHDERSRLHAAMLERDTSRLLEEVAARANRARVTFYPIDARGLASPAAMDVSRGSRRFVPSARNDAVRDANVTALLHLLARETGGFPTLKGLEAGAVAKRLRAEAEGRYVLGIAPRGESGQRRRLRVEVPDSPRLKLRFRESYSLRDATAGRAQRALSALVLGLEQDDLGAVIDRVLEPRQAGPETFVRIRIPRRPMLVEAQRRFRVVIALQGERAAATVRQQEFHATASAEPHHELRIRIESAVGDAEAGVVVEDLDSGVVTVRRLPPGTPPLE